MKMISFLPQIVLFRPTDPDKGAADVKTVTHDETQDKEKDEKEKILCKRCRNVITDYGEMINVNGSHRHDFANPHGYIFDIGCFRTAVGCHFAGNLSAEFTWFSGYSWKYAVCGSCMEHVGWLFISSTERNSFCGLIIDNLILKN